MNIRILLLALAGFFASAGSLAAQQDAGPMQVPARARVQGAAASSTPAPAGDSASKAPPEMLVVPIGTRLPLILQNAVSTRGAKPGDPVFLETMFPVTVLNRIVIPVGTYVQGEILEAKRPGKVKGTGEIRIRLNTMILRNGYTVDFNAVPTNAGTGANSATDNEGKIHGDTNKAGDAGTVIKTTAAGAGIGAIASQTGTGAGIGAGAGAAVGLASVLLTRGPELVLPRGTTLDVILDRNVYLDSSKINFADTGWSSPIPGPQMRERIRTPGPF